MENPLFKIPRFAWDHAGQTSTLYFFQSGQFLKIGISTDAAKRLAELRIGNPHGITVAGSLSVPKSLAYQIERRVHAALHSQRRAGEWFEVEVAEAVRIAETVIPEAFRLDAIWGADAKAIPPGEPPMAVLDRVPKRLMDQGVLK